MSGRLSEGTVLPARLGQVRWTGARADRILPLLALLLALPAGVLAWRRAFDGLYGQDAYAYFDYATESVRQSLLRLQPLEPFFWPPGYPLLVALASFVVGPVPLAGQTVSLVMGALVPVFTGMLVRELVPDDPALAILGGVLAALPGQLWQSSIVVMADTTGLALATLGALALVRYRRGEHLAWLLAASLALAYATLARWVYGLVAVPFAAYALRSLQPGRTALLHAAAALALGAAVLLPVLGAPLVGLALQPDAPAAFAGNLQVYSWSPLNALRRDFFTIDGHLSYPLPNGLYYAVAPANLAFFGPLLAPWALLGAYRAWRAWPRDHLLVLGGWAGVVYAFHAGAPWQNFRFSLAYLPPLAIFVAVGLLWTMRGGGPRGLPRQLGWAVAALALVGLLSTFAAGVRLIHGFVDRKDDELALVRWTAAQTPPGAQLLTFGPTLALRHYSSLPTFDLFDLSPADLSALLALNKPTYVLADEQNLSAQWLGRAPATNFATLRERYGLTMVGQQGSYALFRAGSP